MGEILFEKGRGIIHKVQNIPDETLKNDLMVFFKKLI